MLAPGNFSKNRERTKRTKYTPAASVLGASFIPLVLETFGHLGPSFLGFIKKLVNEVFRRAVNVDVDAEMSYKS